MSPPIWVLFGSGSVKEVFTFQTDLSNLDTLRSTLKEIEQVGPLGLVYHNAARIRRTEALTTPPEEIEDDFRTGNLSLYVIAQWAIPLLQASDHPAPSFFVTNSHLPEAPLPEVLSLSMSKASQQNMFMSLNKAFGKDIHFGLVKACGIVAPTKEKLNPSFIAGKAVELYEQERAKWELSVEIRE
ncbi:hypothetical protein PRZ48_008406 [Zasmidium cellare]|uniref:Uncharacterized protein n=1 Tax=Zasmidium cellare TaxID=395010 RepID=A0ABR0EFS2_ZASCE|nr:hypothetical protein PRZ48_008406 [Zasmidium cellare]